MTIKKFIKTAIIITTLISSPSLVLAQGVGFDSKSIGDVIYKNPTFNGFPINNRPHTLRKWCREEGLKFVSHRTNKVKKIYSRRSAGFNNAVWEVKECQAENSTWAPCDYQVVEISCKQ